MTIQKQQTEGRDERNGERGAALFISMILILILTFMGFGFLTRTMLVTEIAGAERWTTKAFFAADAGIEIANVRIMVSETAPFTYRVQDLRGDKGLGKKGQIEVSVSEFGQVGKAIHETGSQMGAGQGSGSVNIVRKMYGGEATAVQPLTRSESVVSAIRSKAPTTDGIEDDDGSTGQGIDNEDD